MSERHPQAFAVLVGCFLLVLPEVAGKVELITKAKLVGDLADGIICTGQQLPGALKQQLVHVLTNGFVLYFKPVAMQPV